jgi:hypothetical protein
MTTPISDPKHPAIDLKSPEGERIVALFNSIKRHIEDTDGGWNGGDVTQALTEWFSAMGIDPEGPIIGGLGRKAVNPGPAIGYAVATLGDDWDAEYIGPYSGWRLTGPKPLAIDISGPDYRPDGSTALTVELTWNGKTCGEAAQVSIPADTRLKDAVAILRPEILRLAATGVWWTRATSAGQ